MGQMVHGCKMVIKGLGGGIAMKGLGQGVSNRG